MKIKLGDLVRDPVSGCEGIAISRVEYLTGCARIGVQPPFNKAEGKLPESLGFDEPMLEVVTRQVVKAPSAEKDPGGPRPMTPAKK